jgi:hypothetical protein
MASDSDLAQTLCLKILYSTGALIKPHMSQYVTVAASTKNSGNCSDDVLTRLVCLLLTFAVCTRVRHLRICSGDQRDHRY